MPNDEKATGATSTDNVRRYAPASSDDEWYDAASCYIRLPIDDEDEADESDEQPTA